MISCGFEFNLKNNDNYQEKQYWNLVIVRVSSLWE